MYELSSLHKVVDARVNNISWKEIADELGVSEAMLIAAARRHPDYHLHEDVLRPGVKVKRQVTADEIRELIFTRGLSDKKAAYELGMKPGSFTRLRVRRGVIRDPESKSRGPLTQAELDEIEGYLDEGYSYAATAELTGHTPQTVARNFPGRGFTKEQAVEMAVMGQKLARMKESAT